jgi:hypothetical protein
MMASIREEELMAHLDGELPGLQASRIARAVEEDEALRAEAEAQRRLKERLARRFDPIAEEPVPDRFRAMLETNVVSLQTPAKRGLRLGWPQAAAIAASFAVGILAIQMFSSDDRSGTAGGGTLIAAGDISRALETQLASAEDPRAKTRIGVTFAARDGRLCRTFETSATAGLACREAEGWHLVASAPGTGALGEYRQAGSGPASVMRAAERMMAGTPFDAGAERQARDRGWSAR